jgi:hypothetical protein
MASTGVLGDAGTSTGTGTKLEGDDFVPDKLAADKEPAPVPTAAPKEVGVSTECVVNEGLPERQSKGGGVTAMPTVAPGSAFAASDEWRGAMPGYVFCRGEQGQGYYIDRVGQAQAAAAGSAAVVPDTLPVPPTPPAPSTSASTSTSTLVPEATAEAEVRVAQARTEAAAVEVTMDADEMFKVHSMHVCAACPQYT